ncbi:MAG: NAD-dependent epimerase/dehydratase family protein [Rhodobacteraceae bacterium]|nr:MAG: NAD-dependent epimerase/dehydratase family protein [Paracoccaceae bacterium]
MRIAVIGAAGVAGRAFTAAALAKGWEVRALARGEGRIPPAEGLTVVTGDAADPAAMARAMEGVDAAILTVGERPTLRQMALAPETSVCVDATRAALDALPGRARLIVISAYGVGDTRERAPWLFKLYFFLALRAQFADKERQEAMVKASGADWTIVQPVGLAPGQAKGDWLASAEGEIRRATIRYADVAAFVIETLETGAHRRASVALSG